MYWAKVTQGILAMICCVLIAFKYPDIWTTVHNFQVFPSSVMSPSLIASKTSTQVSCRSYHACPAWYCGVEAAHVPPQGKACSHAPGFSCGSQKSLSLMLLTRTSLGLHVCPQAAAALRMSLAPPAPGTDMLCPCPQRSPPPCGVIFHMCCMVLMGLISLAEWCKVITSQFHILDLCLHLPTLSSVWMEADNSAFMKPFLAQPHD